MKFLGSSRPTGGPWPLHQEGVFAGPQPGTVERSLRRSQSRHLNGKALRLLKRVRVTPAVYRPFVPLNGAFRDRHWAGVGSCTHPFGLAATYVFIKQSASPCHCDLLFAQEQAPLLPRLRGEFADFPQPECPDTPWAAHPGAPVSVLGTVVQPPFSRAPGLCRLSPSPIHPLLALTALRRLLGLDGATAPLGIPGSVGRAFALSGWTAQEY